MGISLYTENCSRGEKNIKKLYYREYKNWTCVVIILITDPLEKKKARNEFQEKVVFINSIKVRRKDSLVKLVLYFLRSN